MPARFSLVPNEANRPLSPTTVTHESNCLAESGGRRFAILCDNHDRTSLCRTDCSAKCLSSKKNISTHAMHFLTRDLL